MSVSLEKIAHETVTTSSYAWHSRGITGVTVWPTRGAAMAHAERLRERLTAAEGVFVRPAR